MDDLDINLVGRDVIAIEILLRMQLPQDKEYAELSNDVDYAYKLAELIWLHKQIEAGEAAYAQEKTVSYNESLFINLDSIVDQTRTKNLLNAESIYVVGQLIQNTEEELLRKPGFGAGTIADLKSGLQRHTGFLLGTYIEHWDEIVGLHTAKEAGEA